MFCLKLPDEFSYKLLVLWGFDFFLVDFSSRKGMEYEWSKDEVQTARLLFYVRIIPTCIERLPAPVFRRVVAPTMFLYPKYMITFIEKLSIHIK